MLCSEVGSSDLVNQYLGMICDWGSWDDFQMLLYKLSVIAEKHRVTLTNVAIRWVLQKPQVGAGEYPSNTGLLFPLGLEVPAAWTALDIVLEAC